MLDWFTTIPGILIICGVILLIIAIILFVVGAKKSKGEGNATTEVVNNSVEMAPVTTPDTNVTPVAPVTVEANVTSVNVDSVNTEQKNEITEPVSVEQPVVTEPVVEAASVQMNEPVVSEPVVETPAVDMTVPTQEVVDSNPVSQIEEVKENDATTYGGEAPKIDFTVNEEKTVTIYGGNDPLEATQALPKVEEHHAPYGGAYPEVRIVENSPVVEAPTPVEEVVSTMPIVEPVVNTVVEEAPVVPEVSVAPVVEETIQAPSIPVVEEQTQVFPTPIIIPDEPEVTVQTAEVEEL